MLVRVWLVADPSQSLVSFKAWSSTCSVYFEVIWLIENNNFAQNKDTELPVV